MSSLTSEIRRNTKLVIFTRDSVAALYQEKGSKHQDQLSQSDSAARKTQPLIHTGGAERGTHVSSVVLWDKKNARTKLLKTRRKRDRIFFSNHQHFSSSLTPTTFFSTARTAVVFRSNEFHTKRDATCSRAALAVRGNLEVDHEFTHPSDVRHSPARSVLATITHGWASSRRVCRALTLHLWLSQIINTQKIGVFPFMNHRLITFTHPSLGSCWFHHAVITINSFVVLPAAHRNGHL